MRYYLKNKLQNELKYFRLCGFLLLTLALVQGSGCSRVSVEKPPVKIQAVTCDLQADEAMGLNDYETSIRLHLQFIEKEPENELALYHLGYAYGQAGYHQKEVFFYEKAIVLGLKKDHIFFNLGMAHGELNQLEKAIDAFKEGLALHPTSADNYFGLGLTYERSGRYKAAESALIKAIELDPQYLDARFYLSRLYKDMREFEKARNLLREILEIDPSDINALELLDRLEKEMEGGNKK